MEIWHYILIGLGAILLGLMSVVLVRTLNFKPKDSVSPDSEKVEFNRDRAVTNLQQLVKCRTVSYYSHEGEDEAEFKRLTKMLSELYPHVYASCTLTELDDHGLLYRWEGREHTEPTVLMAHYDVVPVKADEWKKPPFDGVIEDGVLWGRGTLDTKITFASALFAVDHLIESGFIPQRDVYLAFSGCEEVNGPAAVHIVDYFEKNGITPGFVLDEGGAVVENVFPGVKERCAFIGIAEKGMIDLEYIAKSKGGHSSAPGPHTPVGVLSRACCRMESKPFKAHLTEPVRCMFKTLGPRSSLLYRIIFSNLWLFSGLLDIICKKSGGELNAIMRTTVAFTQMQGSSTSNVIPPEATMVSNMRLNPMDSVEGAIEYVRSVINDPNVEVTPLRSTEPSRISRIDTEGYEKISRAIVSTWQGVLYSPYLMVQCSDSRHWGRISDRVYRFSAMDLTKEERSTIHGHNERIRLEVIHRATEFYIRLVSQC